MTCRNDKQERNYEAKIERVKFSTVIRERNQVTDYAQKREALYIEMSIKKINQEASQEISRLLWNPKIHCRVQKSPPLIPILSEMNLVHTLRLHSYL
jgi:hypothetical protein